MALFSSNDIKSSSHSMLALDGGKPVRTTMLPYGRQKIDEDDIQLVTEVLRSDWLTTGPQVTEFEEAFAKFSGTKEAVAVSSGTAALHTAMYAIGVDTGDEVIVPAMTFAASASAVLFQGGTPCFVDVLPETLLIDPKQVEAAITSRTRAIMAVDYAGQPCDYEALRAIAQKRGIHLLADACHAVGGYDGEHPVGSLADLSTFSLHPVKNFTSGEGGLVTTNNYALATKMRKFRNHCISADAAQRAATGSWFYEIDDLGYNYRITDIQCALGKSQLRKLPGWIERRRTIAKRYDVAFSDITNVEPLSVRPGVLHAYHLYVIRWKGRNRARLFEALRAEGIGVNVHYLPVPCHPLYRRLLGTVEGQFPVAEQAYEEILSLPIFPAMSDTDIDDVIEAVRKVAAA